MKKFLVRLRATLRTGGFLGVHSSLTASLGKTSVAWETRSINKVPETRGRLPKLAQREWLSCGCKQWLEAGRWLHPWGVCLETHSPLAASHFLAPSSLYDSTIDVRAESSKIYVCTTPLQTTIWFLPLYMC